MRFHLVFALAVVAVAGCRDAVPKDEHAKVVNELKSAQARTDALATDLKAAQARADAAEKELENLKNGPARLLEQAKAALTGGRYEDAKAATGRLIAQHPGDPAVPEATSIKTEAERELAEAATAEAKRVAGALKAMRVKSDAMRGVDIYTHRDSAKYTNSKTEVFLYFPVFKGQTASSPHLMIQYVADDWLFIESYTIKADDQVFTIRPADDAVERDNGGGGIWEWYDVVVGGSERPILDAMFSARSVTIRFQGKQYYRDRVIPPAEIERMRQVKAAWKSLTTYASTWP